MLGFHSKHVSTLLFFFGVAAGCASASEKGTAGTPPQSLRDGGYTFTLLDGSASDAGLSDGGHELNPLCGNGICGGEAPDDPLACNGHEVGGTDASSPLDASVRPPGVLDASADAARDAGGDPADASVRDGGPPSQVDSGFVDGSSPVGAPVLSCQVSSGDHGALHGCAVSGSGDVASPCRSSHECKPSLACVGSGGTGQCLPYCCDSRTVCAAGTFCAVRPLFDAPSAGLQVPVCAPASQCTLDEPCVGRQCCPKDTACTIVLSDGTTGCVTPGTSRGGEACPCAAGYFCSAPTNSCVKICKTDADSSTCMPGKCQAEAGFPVGFGLCIGPTPAAE